MSNTNFQTKIVTVLVQRFNPDVDKKAYIKEYQVDVSQDTTILDALHEIKTHQDGTVTFRRSCRHAICGSCAMNVNGKNLLVCNTPINDMLDRKGRITIKPLPYLPVIKDLVVDRGAFDRVIAAGGYISVSTGSAPEANETPVPKGDADAAFEAAANLAMREAFEKVGAVMLEPVIKIEIRTPENFLGEVNGDLNARRAEVTGVESRGEQRIIHGNAPVAQMFGYSSALRSATQGRATYTMEPLKYAPMPEQISQKVLETTY